MANDGSLIFDTKVDVSGFEKGVQNVGKKSDVLSTSIKRIGDAASKAFDPKNFEKATAALTKQQAELDALKRKLEAITTGEKAPASLLDIERQMKRISKEIEQQEAAHGKLVARYEAANKKLELTQRLIGKRDSRSLTEEQKLINKENIEKKQQNVDRLDRELMSVGETMDELRNKYQGLSDEADKIKLDPSASVEAQNLADKIQITENKLEKAKSEAENLNAQLLSLQKFESSPITQQIRTVISAIEAANDKIQAQKEAYQILTAVYERAEIALKAAQESGDATAEALAETNLERALKDIDEVSNKTQGLYYETEQLKEIFNQVTLNPDNVEVADRMKNEIDDFKSTLDNAAQSAESLSREINDVFPMEEALAAEENIQDVDGSIQEVNKSSKKTSSSFSDVFRKISAGFNNLKNIASKALGKISGLVSNIGKGFKGFLGTIGKAVSSVKLFGSESRNAGNNINGIASGFATLTKRITSLATAAFFFNVINKGISELRNYLGLLLATNAQFNQSLNAVKVNLLTAFAPIWEVILPALLTFMDILAKVTAALAQFISMIFGKTYQQSKAAAQGMYEQTNATAEATKAAKKEEKAIDNVGKTAKKASKNLQGFDEINRLAEESAEDNIDALDDMADALDSAGAGGTVGGIDFGAVETPDFAWIDDFKHRMDEIMEKYDVSKFFAFGQTLGEFISAWLDDINWSEIETKAKEIAENIADLINGFIEGIDPEVIGRTIAGLINTAIGFSQTLLTNINFAEAGEKVATALNEAVKEIKWADLGSTIGSYFRGILDFLSTAAENFDWANLGKNLADFIQGIIDGIPEGLLGETLGNIFNGILNFITTALEEFDFVALGARLATELNTLISTIDWALLGSTLAGIINSAFEFLKGFIETFDWEGFTQKLLDGLKSFIDGVEWEEIGKFFSDSFKGVLEFLVSALENFDWTNIGIKIREFLESIDWVGIANKLGEVVGLAFKGIGDLIFSLIAGDLEKSGENAAAAFFKGLMNISQIPANLIAEFITGIAKAFGLGSNVEQQFKDVATVLLRVFFGIFTPVLWMTNIVDFVNGIRDLIFTLGTGDFENAGKNSVVAFFKGLMDISKIPANLVSSFIAGISKAFGLGSNVEQHFKDISNFLLRGFFGMFNPVLWATNIVDFVKWIIDKFKELLGIHSPSTVFADIGKNVIQGLLNGIKSLFQSVIGFFSELLKSIQYIFVDIGQWFSYRWEDIKNSFSDVVSWFRIIFSNAWQGIKNVWVNVSTWFNDTVVQPVKKFFTGMWDGLKSGATMAWQGIKTTFSSVSTWFKDTFSTAWNAVKDVFSTGGKIFSGISEGILGGFKNIVNSIIEGINKIIKVPFDGINSALKSIKNVDILGIKPFDFMPTISIPQIPKLAQGAVLPPNRPFLAMVGDQKNGTNVEAPLSVIEEAVINAIGKINGRLDNMTIEVKFTGDGAALAEFLAPKIEAAINGRAAQLGTNGILV